MYKYAKYVDNRIEFWAMSYGEIVKIAEYLVDAGDELHYFINPETNKGRICSDTTTKDKICADVEELRITEANLDKIRLGPRTYDTIVVIV